jgi:predicted nucleic acid-binding Zn ribbon protein
VDDLEPAEGTYDVHPARKPRRPSSGRYCEVCDAELRPDATHCDLCTTRVPEEDEPDSEEKRDRIRRRKRRLREDETYQRLDLIVLQIAMAIVAVLFVGCIPYVTFAIAFLSTGALGLYLLWHAEQASRAETPAERQRWEREHRLVVTHFLLNLVASVVLVTMGVAVLIFL